MEHTGDYRRALAEYIRDNARPPDKFSHQPRLYQLARELGATESFDDDVLFAAAWLHDLGVFVGHRPEDLVQLAAWDHIAYAMKNAPAVLQSVGFPPAKIPAAMETIRTHLPSREPTSIEGTLLRDADILEQLGAIGILRMVNKVGRDTRYPTSTAALKVLRQNAETLPGLLRLPQARRMAEPRLAIMKAFFEAVSAECGGIEP